MTPAQVTTIERHISDTQRHHPAATGVFTNLLYDIALAAKLIARETTRAGLVDIIGEAGTSNIHGERQQKLDVYADQVIFQMNDHTGRLCIMASEEHDEVVPIPEKYETGKYALIYDPLDGSDNIAVNTSIGTIFAIFRKVSNTPRGSLIDVLQRGRALAAAGYVIYGASTMLVYSTGNGVHGFTLDPSVGEFLLSHPNIQIPKKPKYYSVNQGNEKYWTPGIRHYVRWLQGLYEEGQKPLSQRYIGALVADFHRNLLKGGVYMYPGDLRDAEKPAGKLRLSYEAIPLAYLAEQAGGAASDGHLPIMDIQPHSLHQRVPLIIGSRDLVEKANTFVQEYDQEWLTTYLNYRDQPTPVHSA
ncbi:MAG: class 1 fructose-bisphosphatase [Chloroflexi bacterium]|jgi:fructose-1,6-bisphosphatase I|nr:class 1 fructose-bisphosphatase [Chloroflexota bacterium]